MHNPTEAARIVSNARRFAKSAIVTALALDLCAPVTGRAWLPLCVWCLDRIEHDAADEHIHRLGSLAWHSFPGGCSTCAYAGCDTLVVAVRSDLITY